MCIMYSCVCMSIDTDYMYMTGIYWFTAIGFMYM